MGTVTLQDIHQDLEFLKTKVVSIEHELKSIKKEPELREEYRKRLDKIKEEKGKMFASKDEFLNHIENEL